LLRRNRKFTCENTICWFRCFLRLICDFSVFVTSLFTTIVRPPVRSNGRTYKMLVMFLFFQCVISEIPRPITVKLCHMIGNWSYFIIQLPKFGGSPPKNLRAKNMQNFGPFCTTSDFDREYVRNGSRHPKSENQLIESNSSRVRTKRSGELWSTNYRDLDVSLDPLNALIWDIIFRPLGGAAPLNFYTR